MTDDKERRAEEAKRLLEHEPLLQEAFDAVEKSGIEAILSADTDEARRINAERVNTIRAVKQELQDIIAMGNQAVRGPVRVA